MRLQASNLKSDERSTVALSFLSKGHELGGDGNENRSTNRSWSCARASGSTGALPRTSWTLTLMYIVCLRILSKGIFRWGYAIEGISDAVVLAQNLSQLLYLSTNDEALVRWLLKRPRTLKPCKRNYLVFEGSIEKRRRVKGSVYKSVKGQPVLDTLGGTVPSNGT